jgi:two-component system nitrate/nitrite response regulator NarL
MNTLGQETIHSSAGVGAVDSREQVTTLCRAAIDSLAATIENVKVHDILGQLREASHATLTIKHLWAALDQPSSLDSTSQSSLAATAIKTNTVVVCDTQPIVAQGLRTLLNGSPDLKIQETVDSFSKLTALLPACNPSIVIVDRALGMQPVLNWLSEMKSASGKSSCPKIVVWGPTASTPEESFRLLNAGAQAILCKTDPEPRILECLRAVAEGGVWVGDSVPRQRLNPRSRLSAREQQILELVKCGFRNKDIAQELGIREGTVKIHLRNIFEKTGVRSRHALAIRDLCDLGSPSLGLKAAV